MHSLTDDESKLKILISILALLPHISKPLFYIALGKTPTKQEIMLHYRKPQHGVLSGTSDA